MQNYNNAWRMSELYWDERDKQEKPKVKGPLESFLVKMQEEARQWKMKAEENEHILRTMETRNNLLVSNAEDYRKKDEIRKAEIEKLKKCLTEQEDITNKAFEAGAEVLRKKIQLEKFLLEKKWINSRNEAMTTFLIIIKIHKTKNWDLDLKPIFKDVKRLIYAYLKDGEYLELDKKKIEKIEEKKK